jgi:hypothetical protein
MFAPASLVNQRQFYGFPLDADKNPHCRRGLDRSSPTRIGSPRMPKSVTVVAVPDVGLPKRAIPARTAAQPREAPAEQTAYSCGLFSWKRALTGEVYSRDGIAISS